MFPNDCTNSRPMPYQLKIDSVITAIGMARAIWVMVAAIVIALVVVGPSKLPQLGQSLGGAIRSFKKGINEDDVKVVNKTTEA